jgi:hypothetical protein
MAADGLLETKMEDQPGRWQTRFYYPVEKVLITEKYGKRRIVVKRRGVEHGQLEMAI